MQRSLASFIALVLLVCRAGFSQPEVTIPPETTAPPAQAAEPDVESALGEPAPRKPVSELIGRPTQALALRDAVMRAFQGNTRLAVQRVNPEIQNARVLASKGPFDAILRGSATYSRSTVQTSADQSRNFLDQPPSRISRSLSGDISLTKQWATGTQTGVSLSAQRSESTTSIREYFSSVDFNVRQSLLRGLRPAANLATIHQAENNYRASLYGLRSEIINTIADVEITYWNLALAYELLRVQENSLGLAEGQLERTQAFVDVGRLSPLETTSAQAEVASRRRDLIDAKNNLEITAIDLLLLTEVELSGDEQYPLPNPTDEAKLPAIGETSAESIDLAVQNRPDLAQAYLDLENGKIEVIRTKDGLLPRLDLVGSYGLTGRGLEFHQSREIVKDGDFDNYSIGIDFEFPLPNRRARGDYRAAKATEEQFRLAIDNLRNLIKSQVLKARIDLANQIATVDAARAAVTLQEQKLVNEEEKWRNGLSTTLDVFQAQRDLVSSRNQLIISIANALKSETNLYVQEGTLLEVRGIEAEGGDTLK